jgi:selenocysteine-specific elongation factor
MTAMAPAPPTNDSAPARRLILGTAGHIDHGKSALVRALTGIDPDRLPEEKARGMTIDLGFAHLELPGPDGGRFVFGIVDVPGHERFVRTMVAGATGVDLAMLVIAADDGVMPQTREHVEILDLLGVDNGVVVISKKDLVPAERLDDVRGQTRELSAATAQRDWPVVAVSTRTGEGLDELRAALVMLAARVPEPKEVPVFRIAIDRVFAVRGRGTVVTGSVLAGHAAPGDKLTLHPAGLQCRVRELQSHGRSCDGVATGQRAALNLTGIDRDDIERGMELATPGYLRPARYVDARLRVIARHEKPLASHTRVRVCLGTTEAMAMLVVFGAPVIAPGADAPVQLRFRAPVVASFAQRFIIRDETARTTIGGGHVLRPVSRRVRTMTPDEIEAVVRAESPDAAHRVEEAMRRSRFDAPADLSVSCEAGVAVDDVGELRAALRRAGRLIDVGGCRDVHADTVAGLQQRAMAFLQRHHASSPLEPGLSRERLVGWIDRRSAAGCGRALAEMWLKSGRIVERGPFVAHAEFPPAVSPEDAADLKKLVNEIVVAGYDPPAWEKLTAVADLPRHRSKVLEDLARTDPDLIQLGPRQFIGRKVLEEFQATVARLGAGRKFKLAEVRDALGLSRRVVQMLLEYLDRIQYTRRVGDERILTKVKD